MKPIHFAACVLLAAPFAAPAQTTYPSREAPMTREELSACMERDASMRDRLETLDQEKLANDRETDALARVTAQLAADLRRLDSTNASAVAAYNARSAEHNRRVEAHNRRVAEMNSRASLHNGDAADVSAACASRPYLLRDRDALRRDRGSIR